MTDSDSTPPTGIRARDSLPVILLSRTLESLDERECRTSSQLFELRFARAISPWAHVTILSLAPAPPAHDGTVRLLSITTGRLPAVLRVPGAFRKSHLLSGPRPWVVFFGYSPAVLLVLRAVARYQRARIAAFVFDTHEPAVRTMTGAKRWLLSRYFQFGVRLLTLVDALLLLNSRAIERLQAHDVPTLVTSVGSDSRSSDEPKGPRLEQRKATYSVVYAGSLESYNGVLELIEAVRSIPETTIRLHILGSGSLLEQAQRAAATDPRIHVRGGVAHVEAAEAISAADLLVCLRDLNDPVSAYSFPSKLVECLDSGIPVIASPIIDDEEFRQVVELVDSLDAQAIAGAIQRCMTSPEEARLRAIEAVEYVRSHHDWHHVGRDVVAFLENVPRRRSGHTRAKR